MIDIHSHIVFDVDDGPKTIEESLDLIGESYRQGVRTIVSTSHRRKGMFETPESYIAKNLENPSAAISTVRNITKDLRRLREHSLIGASLSSIADVESDYRFLVTGSYLTFYRVLDNDVYVDRVLYGRRDYLRILFGDVQDDETNE